MPSKENPMDDQNEVKVRDEAEVRSAVITEYGFDEEVDAERIERLVAKELDHDRKLSSAIGAKIKHRTEAEELKKQIPTKKEPTEEEKGLSQKDVLYLAKADIHETNVDEVLELAKAMKWDVKQAHEYLKPRLKELDEFRKTAEAAQTKPGARSVGKVTGEDLIEMARKGNVPETQEEIDKLVAAQFPTRK